MTDTVIMVPAAMWALLLELPWWSWLPLWLAVGLVVGLVVGRMIRGRDRQVPGQRSDREQAAAFKREVVDEWESRL